MENKKVNITVAIDADVDERLRKYEWKKWKGKGRHKGEIVSEALMEYLDKREKR